MEHQKILFTKPKYLNLTTIRKYKIQNWSQKNSHACVPLSLHLACAEQLKRMLKLPSLFLKILAYAEHTLQFLRLILSLFLGAH
jgi:hypothetical protein